MCPISFNHSRFVHVAIVRYGREIVFGYIFINIRDYSYINEYILMKAG